MKDHNEHLDFIDGLKGLAILMVVFFHISLEIGSSTQFLVERTVIENLSRGVQLFFIISAFAIFRTTIIRSKTDNYSIASFYIRRFFRIIPLWWLATFTYYFHKTNQYSTPDLLSTLFLYFGFFTQGLAMCVIPVGWSLFVEETFYVVFPLLKKLIANIYMALIFVILGLYLSHIWIPYSFEKYGNLLFSTTFPFANFYAFFIGIFLYFLYEKIKHIENTIPSHFIVLLDILALVSFVGIFWGNRMRGTLLLIPFIFVLFFARSRVRRALVIAPLRFLGKYCYFIYLFHSLIISILLKYKYYLIQETPLNSQGFWFYLFICFLIVTTLSYGLGHLSFQFYEKPMMNLGKRSLKKLNGPKHI